MFDEFSIFKSFTDIEAAKEITEKLERLNIPFQVEDTSSPIDPLIIGSFLDADVRIKLKQKDFHRAYEILEDYYSSQLHKIDQDYYLFDFTDRELNEILEKPDEWGALDYQLAQKILTDRGNYIRVEQIEELKSKRIKEMEQPEALEKSWIYLGYFISILFSPVGIFFGSTLSTSQKTLPNGQKVYSYNDSVRKHGQNMLFIASGLTILWVILKLRAAK